MNVLSVQDFIRACDVCDTAMRPGGYCPICGRRRGGAVLGRTSFAGTQTVDGYMEANVGLRLQEAGELLRPAGS